MKTLYSEIDYQQSKSKDYLKLECYNCKNAFLCQKRIITHHLKGNKLKNPCKFCSKKCFYQFKTKPSIKTKCLWCDADVYKTPTNFKKTKNSFCNQSCAAKYNNRNKKHGTRRSKLEVYLETILTAIYPDLSFLFNKKDIIGSELDIFIPSLKLAFEINGIYHYQPIHGQEKLVKIQQNDLEKKRGCNRKNIKLKIIDTSQMKYFNINNSQPYLLMIMEIIESERENSNFQHLGPKPSTLPN